MMIRIGALTRGHATTGYTFAPRSCVTSKGTVCPEPFLTGRRQHRARSARKSDDTPPPRAGRHTLMKTTLTRVCTILTFAASTLAAQSAGRAFTPQDWYRIARVGGGTLSPDGNTIAFTVTTVIEDKNARHTEIWTQSVSGGPSKRMTAPAFESTAPRWSDD